MIERRGDLGGLGLRGLGLVSGVLLSSPAAGSTVLTNDAEAMPEALASNVPASVIADLPDGTYQFCSEPAPQDWQVGAGVCLNFEKQGNALEGYYGYPHSAEFVCLKGQLSDEVFSGQGAMFVWAGELPTEGAASWEADHRLSLRSPLSRNYFAGSKDIDDGLENWMVFQEVTLNTQGLVAYENPRMTPPNQLCGGQFDSL